MRRKAWKDWHALLEDGGCLDHGRVMVRSPPHCKGRFTSFQFVFLKLRIGRSSVAPRIINTVPFVTSMQKHCKNFWIAGSY